MGVPGLIAMPGTDVDAKEERGRSFATLHWWDGRGGRGGGRDRRRGMRAAMIHRERTDFFFAWEDVMPACLASVRFAASILRVLFTNFQFLLLGGDDKAGMDGEKGLNHTKEWTITVGVGSLHLIYRGYNK